MSESVTKMSQTAPESRSSKQLDDSITISSSTLGLTTTEQAKYDEFVVWYKRMQADADRGPFRFTDLPPELREFVYSFVFANENSGSQCLNKFKLPSIVRVSKLLRKEALPRFFTTCRFHIDVASNFRRLQDSYSHSDQPRLKAGRMNMKLPMISTLKAAGPDALIKDITLNVKAIGNADHTLWLENHSTRCFVHLYVVNNDIEVAIPKPNSNSLSNLDKGDVKSVMLAVKDKAKKIGSREDFKGMTLRDIEQIVRQLKH